MSHRDEGDGEDGNRNDEVVEGEREGHVGGEHHCEVEAEEDAEEEEASSDDN